VLKNNSDVQVDIDDVEWAEYIFVMGNSHKGCHSGHALNNLKR